jgi:hypothetical protein
MQPSTFDAMIIEKWARFSGDRNPIHFDREAARGMGADDIVVHGMIPMVVAQEHLYQELRKHTPRVGWADCSIRLKRPIQRDQPVRLATRPTSAGLRFSLASALREEQFFHGSFERSTARPGPLPEEQSGELTFSLPSFSLAAGYLRERNVEFRRIFPEAQSPWVSFSATLFSEFLARNLQRMEAMAASVQTAPRLFAVQTTYKVGFDERHFDEVFPEAVGEYQCTFAPTQMHVFADGCTTEGHCLVFHGSEPVLELGLGLLLKQARSRNVSN